MKRIHFLNILSLVLIAALVSLTACKTGSGSSAKSADKAGQDESAAPFKISLAEWSYNKAFFSQDSATKADPMDFPVMAASHGIDCIELVNQFYWGHENDSAYWDAFKVKCEAAGVTVGLIMCDGLGNMGDSDPEKRIETVKNHFPWVDIAASLGAHSIRVNAGGGGTREEVAANVAESLAMLAEYAAKKNINVIVENHGGYSSDGSWLSGIMQTVGMDNVGTLPDFGNFCLVGNPHDCQEAYDRYKGTEELMPYAKGVSAKSYAFDEEGNETTIDYLRMMKIVKESGYTGYVGIEYEGSQLSEKEGIEATKALLEKVFAEI
jgi:sugar phosphate isomerase/epimerase